jgi:hypothetical protein
MYNDEPNPLNRMFYGAAAGKIYSFDGFILI